MSEKLDSIFSLLMLGWLFSQLSLRIRRQRQLKHRTQYYETRHRRATRHLESIHDRLVDKAREKRRQEQQGLTKKRLLEKARNGATTISTSKALLLNHQKEAQRAESLEEINLTQQVKSIMRRNGTVAGANSPALSSNSPPSPSTTDPKYVIIRPKPKATVKITNTTTMNNKHKAVSCTNQHYFDIDLSRHRNVEVLRGESILDRGAMALGSIFASGGCSQIRALHLGDCGISRVGLEGLIIAFQSGWGKNLEILTLKKNKLGGKAVVALVEAIKLGSLPSLSLLDLRYPYRMIWYSSSYGSQTHIIIWWGSFTDMTMLPASVSTHWMPKV